MYNSLKNKTDKTNSDLAALDKREAGHYAEFAVTRDQVNSNTSRLGELDESLEDLKVQMGWEILFA